MGFLSLLVSFNKISLIAFIATLAILIYEVKLLRKEKKRNLTIPKFEDKIETVKTEAKSYVVKNDSKNFVKPNNNVVLILVFLLVFFALITLIGFLNINKKVLIGKEKNEQTEIINTVSSKGIKIFNTGFEKITENEINKHKGKRIIIGVETIVDYDIDRARIRVNKSTWDLNDITVNFDQNQKVFYISYKIATNESKLKIEAQLHSATDGWLGD